MNHKEVKFANASADIREILIALMSDAGYTGFEETDDLLFAYIPADEFDPSKLQQLTERYNLQYTVKEVIGTNWNALWESNFEPVIVEDFCIIRAHFHPPVKNILHEIIITPKMSFGTGHHATTYMMIHHMQFISFNKKKVLDFGTGTGILGILAEKSGAVEVLAIDNDENSLENAIENAAGNNCSKISILKADNARTEKQFDIILANITRNVILDNLSHFVHSMSMHGILLLSGLLDDDRQMIIDSVTQKGLVFETETRRDKWLCMKFIKQPFKAGE